MLKRSHTVDLYIQCIIWRCIYHCTKWCVLNSSSTPILEKPAHQMCNHSSVLWKAAVGVTVMLTLLVCTWRLAMAKSVLQKKSHFTCPVAQCSKTCLHATQLINHLGEHKINVGRWTSIDAWHTHPRSCTCYTHSYIASSLKPIFLHNAMRTLTNQLRLVLSRYNWSGP